MKKPLVIGLVGPTAIGKTRLAIQVAQHLQTSIISADSRQMFQHFNIGTAKPTPSERNEAKHHFVDFLHPTADYSAGQFERDVLDLINQDNRNIWVLAGGSGMYVKAMIHGFDPLPHDPQIREKLNEDFSSSGLEAIRHQLEKLDPEYCKTADMSNPQRMIRALEVCLVSGQPYSQLRKDNHKDRPFDLILFGLNGDREWLYERINLRVLNMLEEGLEKEVGELLKWKECNSFRSVGYQEWLPYFEGSESIETVTEKIQQNTRRFAKRQLTYFKNQMNPIWLDAQNPEAALGQITQAVEEQLAQS
ncbi:MAG: tRNA (adenosine(37)-N6)-dimethylallyltransferase MiaA [Flavobacteriales bacterium]|nr:tRNA (adenosine(37)-N6)-dimethylallyltransferase MiaA [Flavobacteriales bacterium]